MHYLFIFFLQKLTQAYLTCSQYCNRASELHFSWRNYFNSGNKFRDKQEISTTLGLKTNNIKFVIQYWIRPSELRIHYLSVWASPSTRGLGSIVYHPLRHSRTLFCYSLRVAKRRASAPFARQQRATCSKSPQPAVLALLLVYTGNFAFRMRQKFVQLTWHESAKLAKKPCAKNILLLSFKLKDIAKHVCILCFWVVKA